MKLLESTQIGDLPVKNRVFMAPLTRSRATNTDHAPVDMHIEYYQQRAGAGLIITEATVVSPEGVGYIHVPGIYSDKQVAAWRKVTDGVHQKGGTIFMQLWHVGRISHPDFHGGKLPVAPSAINPETKSFTQNGLVDTVTPRALETEEVARVVEDFRKAAENAMKAGFDGVEIHSSNGYLFHQFFSDCSNHRTDRYGGSIENKTRFFFEALDAVKTVVAENRIGVRLNPMLHGASGIIVDENTAPTFDYVVNRLNDYDLAYLHVSRPGKILDEPYFIKDVVGHYRGIYRGFLVANNQYEQESGEEEITSGRADAIAYGRLYISNPDLPERFRNGYPLVTADKKTYYSGGEKGYIDYPAYSV
jgi:N-ethylmaleimide reductase